ncbi:Outer membrane protein assembly factor BamB, contains PQQ-like beta-propeller repeat [Bacteroides luti]|uniref:Outer membrane protein assembly factor BamB, contains PQQ-like beta-propeller repeat n=1 Tax=Bacteroides luti TaxID=1297750 RepID=A0A1M4ZTY5_9BACE|nr:PQQ-binding-like beta-propeller repeat protein [Bacteroides luti]SHF21431.1 Outer membrane protein assembly factor BamB, contains PQQ-like beta-propeller repeat [Bacteroides luti]
MKKVFLSVLFCLIINSLRGENFRFALLTDLHVSGDSLAYNDLRKSVEQINKTKDIDFVIVSGDVTEEGDRASLKRVKSLLDLLKMKYYITSGNHETKWSESGATDFGHIFGSDRFKFEYNGILFLGFNSGPVIRMADGHVSPQDISWMKKELATFGKDKPVILVTHYPLQEGDVDNWYDVTDAVRQYNIRAFLGGHYHRNLLFNYDGIPGIICRSNLRGKEKVGGYSVFEVTPDSLLVYEQKIGNEPEKWASYSLRKSYYNSDDSGYKRPDYSINKEYDKVKELWIVKTAAGIYSSPVIYNKNVYVGDDLGFLSCYSLSSGKKMWEFKSGNRIVGTPAASNGVVVFGSADKKIYGVNAKTGKLCWEYTAKEAVLGAVTIDNGIAYIGASDHTFRAIDVKTGKLRWEYTDVKGYIETRPLIYEGKVIFGAWDNNLYALDKESGRELWKWNGNLTRMHFSPAAVWPVAANGKVFITDPQRAMTAIDANSGKTIWRTFQSTVRETIGLSADKMRLYSKTMQDSVVCFSTEGNVPKQIWATDVKFGYEHAPSMLVEKDGVVFGSTKSGVVFALEAFSGKLLWKHKVGNSLISTVVPLSATECVFTSTSGEVGILKQSSYKR